MPTRLVHLVIDAVQPAVLARFWAAVLGWQTGAEGEAAIPVRPDGYRYLDPVALPLLFAGAPEAKTGQNRVHLDLATRSAAHQAAEVKRLLGLGAVPAGIGQGDVPWVVLADPEGNEFCVLEPRAVYRDTGPVAAVVASCRDPVAAGRFWRLATGWVPGHSLGSPGPASRGVSLRSPAGVGPYLELLPAAEPKAVENRLHLDVAPLPGDDQAAEVAALRAAGAAPAGAGQGAARWVVLADPEGSEFCVLTPR